MTWLLAYGIGALVWLAVALFAAQQLKADDPMRRKFAIVALRDAVIWPVALLRFAACVIEAIPEAVAEQHKDGGAK